MSVTHDITVYHPSEMVMLSQEDFHLMLKRIKELEAQSRAIKGVIQEYDNPTLKCKIVSTSPTTRGIYKSRHGEYVHLKTLMDKLKAAIIGEDDG